MRRASKRRGGRVGCVRYPTQISKKSGRMETQRSSLHKCGYRGSAIEDVIADSRDALFALCPVRFDGGGVKKEGVPHHRGVRTVVDLGGHGHRLLPGCATRIEAESELQLGPGEVRDAALAARIPTNVVHHFAHRLREMPGRHAVQ